MADTAEGRQVYFPKREASNTGARVKQTLGPLVAVANPLDYHTFIWNNEPAMTATFTAMVSGGFDLNMLVLDFPRSDRCSDADWWATINAFEAALKANGAKGAHRRLDGREPAGGILRRADQARHRAALRHRRGDGRGGGGGVRSARRGERACSSPCGGGRSERGEGGAVRIAPGSRTP